MLVSLYDEIIDSILHIIDRLDLSVEKEKPDDENNDETTMSDPVFGMRPVKLIDFQIFYNLVEFCQYPLVSGIYRFATFVMNICLELDYFKSTRSEGATTEDGIEKMDIDINETGQVVAVCVLVRRFAHEVLSRQKQYRDDLLVSCLQFIMSLPSECIDYVPAIQLALNLGLTYLPLSEPTINSLERWSRDDVNVRAVVSSLQEKTRFNSKSKHALPTRMLKKTKQIKHLFEGSDIRRVQFRILKYLGSLGNCVNHYLIDDTSNHLIKEAVARDNENHITFNVPFDDLKPILHLDIFLSRIVDLALHSADHQTKITACELLQSIVLYMIGKSANNRSSLADGMISGRNRNASIRDFSGTCLKEFLKRTIKHADGYDQPAYLKNATSILKRILSFSLHPNSFKRLGSTLAWNSIYTLYRSWTEVSLVVTVRWLFRQCGRIETESRRKCIELVSTFIPLLLGMIYIFILVKNS
ncbi:unnamed protein product [Rotaria magnacalcarata]|uniref:Uncharacterized protein n=1 Tax=Rotaria magnacalcarata TaxID=392030 RepID=A0A816VJY8_9BILA|nr:unnamed protein product [Rotaria magnacalcarata]